MVACHVIPDNVNGVWGAAFDGELTPLTMLEVRTTVLKCVAESPAAIIVDLHGCHGDPQLSLAMLPTVARQACDRGVRVIYTVGGGLAAQIRRHALSRFLELYSTRAEAQEAALGRGTRHWLRLDDLDVGSAANDVPEIVRRMCQAWDLDHVAGRAEAIVSDMMAATSLAAGRRVDVSIALLDDLLHLRAYQRRPAPVPADRRGPGLRRLARHATAWGVVPRPEGRLVWATVRTRPAQAPVAAATVRDIRSGRSAPAPLGG